MNIFFFDIDPDISASYLCDKHVVKMPTETAQIISTAYFILSGKQGFYRPTHAHHPCVVWATKSHANLAWLCEYTKALGREYTKRYGKTHAAVTKLVDWLATHKLDTLDYKSKVWSDPPQCMPEEYRRSTTAEAYRIYYIKDKSRFAVWNKVPAPEWYRRAV